MTLQTMGWARVRGLALTLEQALAMLGLDVQRAEEDDDAGIAGTTKATRGRMRETTRLKMGADLCGDGEPGGACATAD